MKNFVIIISLFVALGFAPQILLSQGTICLSNLGESATDSSIQGGEQPFETGASSNGYMLNSVTLLMANWAGYASNFSVSIYIDNSGQVGALVSALSGNTDPETAGQYVYTTSGITLNSTTPYWIVAACDRSPSSPPFPSVGYTWLATTSTNYVSANGWSLGAAIVGEPIVVGDNTPRFLQFALNATPIPEPSIFALLALGGLFFVSAAQTDLLPKFRKYRCRQLARLDCV